jgi:hypothetical protein
MFCSATPKHPKLYGYVKCVHQAENDADIKAIFQLAAKDKGSKLVVFGGLHGYHPTGAPTGQAPAEKKACSFALGDLDNKRHQATMNFIYDNIAKYTTKGSDVTEPKQRDIAKLAADYLKTGHYVLFAWCHSKTWAEHMGL